MRDGAFSSSGSSPVERRLATILITDVFDYSRLMDEDEERTVRALRGHRERFDQLLGTYKGRTFNTAGDAILAEFPSAVEAVRCAVEAQAALRTRNEQLPHDQRMWFRIGINLGDVIVQGGDLLGDGVNVAARIQSIAEPGGVCISGSVYDQIRDKLTLQFKSLGEQNFKNIVQPIRTFSISVDDRAPRPLALRWRTARKARLAATAGTVALIVIGAATFWVYRDYGARVAEDTQLAQESQRVAERRLKAEQQEAAAVEAKKEEALRAQLQSAKEMLAQVEAAKVKAAREGGTAGTTQPLAKLQDELKAAKEAMRKAQQSGNATAQRTADAPAAVDTPSAAMKANPVPPGSAAAVKDVDRFDGVYAGQLCSPHVDNTLRCWDVRLKAARGTLSAVWPSPWNSQLARASGTISPDGGVELSLAGFRASDGRPNPGNMAGRWSENTITAAGSWTYGGPVTGVWKWSPDPPVPTDEPPAAMVNSAAENEAPGSRAGGERHRHR